MSQPRHLKSGLTNCCRNIASLKWRGAVIVGVAVEDFDKVEDFLGRTHGVRPSQCEPARLGMSLFSSAGDRQVPSPALSVPYRVAFGELKQRSAAGSRAASSRPPAGAVADIAVRPDEEQRLVLGAVGSVQGAVGVQQHPGRRPCRIRHDGAAVHPAAGRRLRRLEHFRGGRRPAAAGRRTAAACAARRRTAQTGEPAHGPPRTAPSRPGADRRRGGRRAASRTASRRRRGSRRPERWGCRGSEWPAPTPPSLCGRCTASKDVRIEATRSRTASAAGLRHSTTCVNPVVVAQQRFPDRMPLRLVAVEQLRPASAGGDQGQLPRQVAGVLDARVHSLAADRRMDVRGVAGEEDVAAAVVGRLPLADVEARHPCRIAEVRVPWAVIVRRFLELLHGRLGAGVGDVAAAG